MAKTLMGGVSLTISHYRSINLTIAHYRSINLTIAHYRSINLTIAHYRSINLTIAQSISLFGIDRCGEVLPWKDLITLPKKKDFLENTKNF